MYKKIVITACLSIVLSTHSFAEKINQYGDYGFIDSMPYTVGQCFNNIKKIKGNMGDYDFNITYNTVSAVGKKTVKSDRCGVFVFNDAIVGAMQDYEGYNVKTVWYIKSDGVHLYGENGSFTGAMQYALSRIPHKKIMFLHNIDGSFDDNSNLYTTRVIRMQGYNTVLPNGGKIYSGGVDFFLAGKKRAIEGTNFDFGVHSWENNERQGKDYPRDDEEHQMFLETMRDLNIDTRFYWYTLEVAPADGMHLMSLDEIKNFGIVNTSYKEATK